MIGLLDGCDHGVKMLDELGVVASDLVLPDPDEKHDLVPVRIGDDGSTRFLARHLA
jgi:hypothetical protein